MGKQTPVGNPIYSLLPTEVEGFGPLAELALDMRGPGVITPTTCGGSLILLFGNSPKTPGLFSRRSRGTSSGTC